MLREHSDLPLAQDVSTRHLPWMIGFMVYIASLSLAGALALQQIAETWTQGLAGTITVQLGVIPDETEKEVRDRATRVVAVLLETEGIESARPVPTAEIQSLLEPWLGPGVTASELPLPQLIDVRLAPGAQLSREDLTRRISAVAEGVSVDDHQAWRQQLVALTRSLQGVAAVVVTVVTVASIVMVVFATRGGLAAHRPVIDVLHLIGAQDQYIARQFQSHAWRLALKGGLSGTVLAIATVFGLRFVAHDLGAGLVSPAILVHWQWVLVVLLPFATALIAMLTARRTVVKTLEQTL